MSVKRLVLDVLKPHNPSALEFSQIIASVGPDYRVQVMVAEVDEKTETLVVTIEASAIDFDLVHDAIKTAGGSLHSIDEAEVHSDPRADVQ